MSRVAGIHAPAMPSPIARLLEDDGTLLPQNSIVMHSKLARSSMAEPYFKTRQQQKAAKTSDSAELLQLKKKHAAMSRDFQSLLAAHERQESAVSDLRQKMRALRSEVEQRDKALELARKTVDRLHADKGQLEAGAAGTQAYVRKLESRLLSVKHAAELQQRCTHYKAQVDQLAHAVHEAETRAAAAEAAATESRLDAACLKRGLELAAQQLTKSAGAEVPGTLLRAVARGQEEALGLSQQLSDAKHQVAQLTTALEQARQHMQAQQQALTQAQAERDELRQRAEAGDASLDRQRATTSELRRVLDALKPKAGALAAERDSLRQQLEMERTAAAEAQKEAKQLRATLKHKSTTEVALRDELRWALAGEGLTPSPAAARLVRSPGAAVMRPQGHVPSRSGGSRLRLHSSSEPLASASTPPAKRDGAALSPRAQPSHKVVVRQASASAWEQQEPQEQPSFGDATLGSLPGGPSVRQQQSSSQRRAHGSGGEGLIAAEPSPTRALLRLQEQRRQQQGSRLGPQAQQGQGEHVCWEQPPEQSGWEHAVAGWQVDLAEALPSASAAAADTNTASAAALRIEDPPLQPLELNGSHAGPPAYESCHKLLSPPNSGARPADNTRQLQQHKVQALPLPPVAAEVLFVQDGRLMQVYSTVLDEQIAALEIDLAQLGVAGAPSPISQMQLKSKTAAVCAGGAATEQLAPAVLSETLQDSGVTKGGWPSVVQADDGGLVAAKQQLHHYQQQVQDGQSDEEEEEEQDAMDAWQPNTAFGGTEQQGSLPAGQELQRQMSTDASGSAGVSGADAERQGQVPPLWHSNPLAYSSPRRHREGMTQEGGEAQAERLADGAVTIRARPLMGSPAGAMLDAVEHPAAVAASKSGSEEEWLWAQQQQQSVACQGLSSGQQQQCQPPGAGPAVEGVGSVASSPSLRLHLPATRSVSQPHMDAGCSAASMAAGTPAAARMAHPPQLEVQPHVAPVAATGACSEASAGGAQSLSHRWELPSPGTGISGWLSTEVEADIEQLEVNSGTLAHRRDGRQRQQQQPQHSNYRTAQGEEWNRAQHAQQPVQKPQQQGEAAVIWAAGWTGGRSDMRSAMPAAVHEQQQLMGGSSGGWSSPWGASSSCDADHREGLPLMSHCSTGQHVPQAQRAAPLLPGLALVSSSSQAAVVADTHSQQLVPEQQQLHQQQHQQQQVQHLPQPQQRQQQHTLFDLAGMDMSDFLSA